MIDFVYDGEVNVCQEDLNSFLLCAEELQIKGLSESGKRQSPSSKCKIQETNSGSSGEQVESRGKRVLDEEDRSPSDALKKKKKIAACFQPKSPHVRILCFNAMTN